MSFLTDARHARRGVVVAAAFAWAAFGLSPVAATPAAPGEPADVLTEAELVRAVLSQDLAEASRRLAAARREAAERARVSAPRVALQAQREESLGRDTEFTTQSTGVAVTWELSRRQRWAREAGAAGALEADAQLEADLVALTCESREVALGAWVARRDAALREATNDQLARLEAAMLRLVEAGEQSPHDLGRLRLEAESRRADALLARADALALEASLASIAGRAPTELALTDAGVPGSADTVVASGLETNPRLRALSRRLDAMRAGSEVARRDAPAELELRAAHRSDDAPDADRGDGYEMEVTVVLPSAALRRSSHARARADELAVETELERARRDAELAIRAAHARWLSLQERAAAGGTDADPFGDLVDGARRRYDAGEGSMTEMLDALAAVEDVAASRLRLEAARRLARVELDCATGLATAPDLRPLIQERLP